MKLKLAYLALLLAVGGAAPLALGAQVVAVLPSFEGATDSDRVFLQRSAEALQIGLAKAKVRAIAPDMDPSSIAMVDEISSQGGSGANSAYAKLAQLAKAEQFVFVKLYGATLNIEWRDGKGVTRSGSSVQFKPAFDQNTDLLNDVMTRLVVPDLVQVPYQAPLEFLPYAIPGWGHFEKGYPLEGSLMAGIAAGSVFAAVWALRSSSINMALSGQATNNTNAKFYYDQAQGNTYLALGSLLVYGLDALWSGMTNAGLKERRLRELVVWKE